MAKDTCSKNTIKSGPTISPSTECSRISILHSINETIFRFFDVYKQQGIEFWGLTAQNEPTDGGVNGFPFNCMGWNAENQSIFVGENLGPTLEAAGYGNIQIMVMDDQRSLLPGWPTTVSLNVFK